jgi:hypothetical protein
VIQQLFGINDPAIQRALVEPANLGYIKNVLGITELVIPGEDSRNKQLREIQQLLTSPPIVVPVQVPTHMIHGHQPSGANGNASDGPQNAEGASVGAQHAAPQLGEMSAASSGSGQPPLASHQPRELVLPSVPIDQLLDDHATEFEECKRWANSDAGQAARMTNPAGFANVRAHAEAHLRAMQQLALAQQFANAAANTATPPAK